MGKYRDLGSVVDRCESYIERRFAVALLFSDAFDVEAFSAHNDVVARMSDGMLVHQQIQVGRFRVDFGLSVGATRVAIELDGARYHSSPDQVKADNARSRDLTEAGWTVIRFCGSEVRAGAIDCAKKAVKLTYQLAKQNGHKAVVFNAYKDQEPVQEASEETRISSANALLEAIAALQDPKERRR